MTTIVPTMPSTFTTDARRLGITSAIATVLFIAIYAATLAIGFATLPSPDQPIGDPWFSILEILILVLAPFMVAWMAAVHAWAPVGSKVLSLLSLIFMAMAAVTTSGVHFAVLTLSRQPEFFELDWLLSFRWPSVVYAMDVLAWDVFFPLSVLFAAPVFSGNRLAVWTRWLLVLSGVLALAGLSGMVLNDMTWRNAGIVGYVGGFPVAAVLMAVMFWRMAPRAG